MQVKKEELKEKAIEFVEELEKSTNNLKNATVVALYGELGSGKTTFTKEVGSVYGINENIISPTFLIEKVYKLENSKFKNLIHIDAYRLKGKEELNALGWEEILKKPQNVLFIEWAENIKDALPKKRYNIYFKHIDEETREIKIEPTKVSEVSPR